MTTGETVFLVISAIVFLLGVRAFFPRSIFFFSPSAISSFFQQNPGAGEDLREDTGELVTRLSELGYKVTGVLTEKSPLWGRSAHNIIMTMPGATEYAAVVQGKKNVFYYFQTLFEDGRVAVTAESGFRDMRSSHLYQNVVKEEDMALVHKAHRNYVEEFSKEGAPPRSSYNPEVLENSTHLYYEFPESRHGMRRFGGFSLALLIVLAIPLIISIVNVL